MSLLTHLEKKKNLKNGSLRIFFWRSIEGQTDDSFCERFFSCVMCGYTLKTLGC